MKQIHFIVNPIAGQGKYCITHEVLDPYFRQDHYSLKVKYSDYKKHATKLTQESIAEGAHIVVACGGDGTINEVASCLVGSKIPLGIIPSGSGNGLASNLRIPNRLMEAVSIIKNGKSVSIDVGHINGRYFFSNTGIGFDASVIRNYEASHKRTLSGYIGATLASFRQLRKVKKFKININDVNTMVDPFMIFVSNSNELGYRVSFTPKASLQDGLLDVLIIPKMGRFDLFLLGLFTLLKKPHLLKKAKSFQTKNLQLHKIEGDTLESQIDGDSYQFKKGKIAVSIIERSLRVLVYKEGYLNK